MAYENTTFMISEGHYIISGNELPDREMNLIEVKL